MLPIIEKIKCKCGREMFAYKCKHHMQPCPMAGPEPKQHSRSESKPALSWGDQKQFQGEDGTG